MATVMRDGIAEIPVGVIYVLDLFKALQKEQRRLLELELQYVKAGLESRTMMSLSRMRMQAEAGQQGPSPESMSASLNDMMADLKGQMEDDGKENTVG